MDTQLVDFHELTTRNKNMSTTSDRACLVCGDRTVSGTHFGAITCESCKAFFRRNALNNQNKYVCISAGNCKIDVETRIYCKKCRLDKCFAIGMKSSLIIVKQKRGVNPDINGNYENTQQLNNKLQVNGNMFDNNKCKTINEQNNKLSNNLNVNQLTANKLNSNNTIKPLVMPIIRPISDYSNTFNELESNRLCELLDALKLMVYPVVNTGDQLILQNFMEAHDVVLDRQEHEIQNIIKMSKSLHTFNSLTEHDKLVLIKYSAIPINNLRLLMKFDYDDMAWTVCTKNGLFNVRLDLFKMSSNMDPYNIHHNFLTSMGLEWDSEVLAIHLLYYYLTQTVQNL
ncbi:unnamed protein product [Medioppia subpectinata]|uniref:Uncharacterized protein n=1 Tax=Medioppia subpectinata TaxID=1979941 RepID=A0A7R9KB64_9ACAR|nr:unnamed protein product [Medioppia subpectinata]CAG2100068.1 unnamed protein product [Medioppia subpectinata]